MGVGKYIIIALKYHVCNIFFSYLGKTGADREISKLCDNIQERYFAKEKNFKQSGKRQLLHKILDGHEYLSENQLFKALNYFSQESGFHSYVKDLLPLVPTNETFTEGIRRKPTVLILDKEIQGLPWESMEFLKGKFFPFCLVLEIVFYIFPVGF
jgi:hypothetical protein